MRIVLDLLTRSAVGVGVLLLALLLALAACKNDKSIQGFDPTQGFDETDVGAIRSTIVDTLDIVFSLSDTLTPTGNAPLLSLGSFEEINAQILLKFPIPDSVTIRDARLHLRTSSIFGPNLRQTFDATLHEVTAAWDEDSVTAINFGESFNSAELSRTVVQSTYRVDSLNIEVVTFEMDEMGAALLQQWADSTSGVENNGFLVNSNGSTFIKEFFSNNSSPIARPLLELEVEDAEGVLDTMSVLSSADAYIARRDANAPQPPAELLYVDNIFTEQSIIKFDLSEIPREATINQATMILKVQQEYSRMNENGFVLNFVNLEEDITSPESFSLEPPFGVLASAPEVDENTSEISIPVRGLLQAWVNETTENHGLLVRTATPGLNISRIALCSGGIDSTAAPRLEVDYTVPPTTP